MAERFQSLAHYIREAAGVTCSAFLEVHKHPVLLWSKGEQLLEVSGFQFETFSNDYNNEQPGDPSPATQSQISETLVTEIRKHSSSGPSTMICVGRAANNDIVFTSTTVSKLHAYFLKADGDSYEIVDADSTNGTRVNSQQLLAYQNQPLYNRDLIQFGPSIQVMYLSRQGFYEFLQHLQRSGIV
ncbi:MAG: FHA domain-containing protein [Syntrophobacteria bacterium]